MSRRRPRSTAWQTGPCRWQGPLRSEEPREAGCTGGPGLVSAQPLSQRRTLLEARLPHEPREAPNFLSYSGEPQGHHGVRASSHQARGRTLGRPQPFKPLSPSVHGSSGRLGSALAQQVGSVQGLRSQMGTQRSRAGLDLGSTLFWALWGDCVVSRGAMTQASGVPRSGALSSHDCFPWPVRRPRDYTPQEVKAGCSPPGSSAPLCRGQVHPVPETP